MIPIQPRGFGETMRRDAWGCSRSEFVVLGSLCVRDRARGRAPLRVRAVPVTGISRCCWEGSKRSAGGAAGVAGRYSLRGDEILWGPADSGSNAIIAAILKACGADPPSCAVGEPRN